MLSRCPVILLHFHLNPGTGGDGFHRGGDGVVRELVFRRKQLLSVLCERRSAFQPYGLQGKKEFSVSHFNLQLKSQATLFPLTL